MRIQGSHSLGRRLNAIALCIAVTITAALAANHLFAAYDYETRRIQAASDTISDAGTLTLPRGKLSSVTSSARKP